MICSKGVCNHLQVVKHLYPEWFAREAIIAKYPSFSIFIPVNLIYASYQKCRAIQASEIASQLFIIHAVSGFREGWEKSILRAYS